LSSRRRHAGGRSYKSRRHAQVSKQSEANRWPVFTTELSFDGRMPILREPTRISAYTFYF